MGKASSRCLLSALVALLVGCAADSGGSDNKPGASSSVNPPASGGATGGTAAPGTVNGGTGGKTTGTSGPGQAAGGGAGIGTGAGTGMMAATGGAPAPMNLGTGGTTTVQTGGTGGSGGMMAPPPTPHMGETCLQAGNGMYTEPGPYQVGMMDVDLGMIEDSQHTGMFTIFYPMPLEESCLHPIVAWGNGTTVMGSQHVRVLQQQRGELGHGRGRFVRKTTPAAATSTRRASTGCSRRTKTAAACSITSSARARASRATRKAASARPGRVAPERRDRSACRRFGRCEREGLGDDPDRHDGHRERRREPGHQCTRPDVRRRLGRRRPRRHRDRARLLGYTRGAEPKGTLQLQRLYAAWFRCFLGDDQTACKMFEGGAPDNCGICKDPGWHALASANL